jgi:hypothetical protein
MTFCAWEVSTACPESVSQQEASQFPPALVVAFLSKCLFSSSFSAYKWSLIRVVGLVPIYILI